MAEPARINENDLMQKLVSAKKVMNKVDGKSFTTGNIDPKNYLSSPEDLMKDNTPQTNTPQINSTPVNTDKIRNSKLPKAIQEAMINNPIPQADEISLDSTLNMSFLDGAKKLMEKEGLTKSTQLTQPQTVQSHNTPQVSNPPTYNGDIASIVRETIKDTLEEIVDRKLDLLLNASKTASINENLVLKVGDSIFKGKITGVKKSN
jgi:hypothetical protein